MNKKKTALQSAYEDVKGYKTFSKVIEIDFVLALFENVYLEMETKQLLDAFENGKNDNFVTPEHFFVFNYKQYVNRRMRENGEKTLGEKFWETPIADFDFSVRAYNVLRSLNVETLGDLVNLSERTIHSLNLNVPAKKIVYEIKDILNTYNLEMKK